ncbi:hypothetical protein L6R52_34210 [Myxococcota bacterium]|nr:hypothetical protein [Myxococcota bacterium]
MGLRAGIVLCALVAPISATATAFAQDAPGEDPASAVKIARAAFEYRDFQRVVDLLRPWVHPPRISDRALMIDARRLLGVAFHVLGDITASREEFGQLLLQDPRHELDPFTVPPKVIETFEAVRREMKPALDRLLAEQGSVRAVPEPRVDLTARYVPVALPSRWITLVPGGVPQLAMDQPEWGVALGTAQLVGLAANVGGYFLADAAANEAYRSNVWPEDDPAYRRWRTVMYAGLGWAVASYVASVVLGNVTFEGHTRAELDRAAAAGEGPPRAALGPGGLSFTFASP